MAFSKTDHDTEEPIEVLLTIRGRMAPSRLAFVKKLLADQDVEIVEGSLPPTPAIPTSQRTLLGLLKAAGGQLTTNELAEQSGFPANTIRPLMARLVGKSLVARDPAISGPRIWKLTEAGRAALTE